MKNQFQILVVEDESASRQALMLLLSSSGYQVQGAESGEKAIKLLEKNYFNAIVTDLFLPGLSGIDILKKVKKQSPNSNVILITGNASAETAVEAMKEGAFDYITKPINFEQLKIIIAKALEKTRLVAENLYLRQQLRGKYKFENIIGNSLTMQALFSRMGKVVNTDSTILVLGESGTGKELVAKALHFNGPRKEKSFIAINCGAIPAELLESELFGHVKGAFTGAITDKPGKFELAHQGTIFLDEIGTMPFHLQTKLLRVLQEHEIERVGDSKKFKLNVRIISATNSDLEELVQQGKFRDDLFYRLNVIPINIPPLRERQEDIALLARHFLAKNCNGINRAAMSLSSKALNAMENYYWPGNVREMENVIERAVTLSENEMIEQQDLPPQISKSENTKKADTFILPKITSEGIDMEKFLGKIELQMIQEAMELTGGVKARAATLLKIKRTTLVEKLKRAKPLLET